MKHLAENIILHKIRESDQKAFRYVYDVYFQRLLIFSRKFVSEDQAKDLVQDCFFQFWTNRKKIEINRSLSA
jgi:RNA polymerase sigma-70 factor (ECF subfamily)